MTQLGYSIGQRVKALSAIDVTPYAVISPGETGTVAARDDTEGFENISVLWDIPSPRITDLFEPETDSIVAIAALVPSVWPRRLKIAAALALVSVLPAPWNWTQTANALSKLTDAYLTFAWPF